MLGMLCASALVAHAAGPWTLDQAIRHALTNSPDARIAQHRIAAAQAGLNQARAAFSPQLQFQSSYLRTDNPMLAFGSILNQRSAGSSLDFNSVPDQDNANFRGLLTLPLYAGGRNVAARDAARASAAAARCDAVAVRNALEFEVARAFHTVTKTREFITATEAGAQAFETNLTLANRRFSVGTLLKSDVLDVEVRLAQAREEAVRARNANALAVRALRNLLGIEQGDLDLADSAPATGSPVPDSGDFHSRSELAVSAQKVRAAEADTRRASSGSQPRVSAFGSLDYDYGTRTDGGGRSYTAGVLLQWDLWDGLGTRAQRQAADANLETAREQQRKLRLALDLELEQARLALREAGERLAVTAKSVAQAAESADLTRSRFEQGLAISTQLIDAETALIAARVRRAEAEADRRIAVAAVRQALGLSQLSNDRLNAK
jgi:outer membrane protein